MESTDTERMNGMYPGFYYPNEFNKIKECPKIVVVP